MRTIEETKDFIYSLVGWRGCRSFLEDKLNSFFGVVKRLNDSEDDDDICDDSFLYSTQMGNDKNYIDIQIFYIKDKHNNIYVTETEVLDYQICEDDEKPKMLITKEIVDKVIDKYNYTENTDVVCEGDDIKIIFNTEQAQMNLIYRIGQIVDDIIINEFENHYDMCDVPWIDAKENKISVLFRAKDFTR